MDTLATLTTRDPAMPEIRLAMPDDLPALHAMIGALATQRGDAATISPETLDRIALRGAGVRVLVAGASGAAVGYALLLLRHDMLTGRASYEVNQLFVLPEHRLRGIGRALVDAARELAEGEGRSHLSIPTRAADLEAAVAYRAMRLAEQPQAGPRFRVEIG